MERQDGIDRALDDYQERYLRPTSEVEGHALQSAADVLALREIRARTGLVFADSWAHVPTEEEYELLAGILAQARGTVAGWGGTLRFVYLPAGELRRHVASAAEEAVTAAVRARTLALVRGLSIPVIDVGAVFAARPDAQALFACPECHYTAAGYRVAADAVLSSLPVTAAP